MASRFECEHCLKVFRSYEARHHHQSKYHGYDPIIYKCEKCPKTFKYKHFLIEHLSDVHQQANMRYECGQCTSSYKNYYHLKQHIKFMHDPNRKPFKCQECSKAFIRRDTFAQHMRYVHARIFTLHRCELCNKIYKSKTTLLKHISVNHDENFKRSACPLCPSEFKWPHHLKQHINKVHIQLNMPSDLKLQTNRCTLCFIAFNEKLEMLVHMRTAHNLDIDIYKCCQCTAVFNLKYQFLTHLENHEANKGEHKCEQCHPVLNPKLCIEGQQQNRETDFTIENEIVDFEVAIMEDSDLRQLIKYKLRHPDKSGTFHNLHSSGESDDEMVPSEPIVELTIGTNSTDDLNYRHSQQADQSAQKSTCEDSNQVVNNFSSISIGNAPVVSDNEFSDISSNHLSIPDIDISENNDELSYTEKQLVERFSPMETSRSSWNKPPNSLHTDTDTENNDRNVSTDTQEKVSNNQILSDGRTNTETRNESSTRLLRLRRTCSKNEYAAPIKINRKTPKTRRELKCELCSLIFSKAVDFARHTKNYHTVKIVKKKIYNCKLCPAVFEKLHLMGLHMKDIHKSREKNFLLKKQNNYSGLEIPHNEQNINTKDTADSHEQSLVDERGNNELSPSLKSDLLLRYSSSPINSSALSDNAAPPHSQSVCTAQSSPPRNTACDEVDDNTNIEMSPVETDNTKIITTTKKSFSSESKLYYSNASPVAHTSKTSHSKTIGKNKAVFKDSMVALRDKESNVERSMYKESGNSNTNSRMSSPKQWKSGKHKLPVSPMSSLYHHNNSGSSNSSQSPDKVHRVDDNLRPSNKFVKRKKLHKRKPVSRVNNGKNEESGFSANEDTISSHCSQNAEFESPVHNQGEVSDTYSVISSPGRPRVDKCGKCDLVFSSKLDLFRHISSAHLNIKQVKSFKSNMKESASRHFSSTRKSNKKISHEKKSIAHAQSTRQEKSYWCAACKLNFNAEANFMQHMKMEHRHKCGICSIAFVHKDKLSLHLQNEHKDRPREHKCDVCSVVFKLAASLAKHMDEKHKSLPDPKIITKDIERAMHKCANCGALFPLRESLQRHIQLEHDTGSVHKCGECTAVFNDVEEFKEHLLIEHVQY